MTLYITYTATTSSRVSTPLPTRSIANDARYWVWLRTCAATSRA
ncbi:hypothetical protein [Actinophytocola sp.]|nr:hypothetical protein [Actinophytocola sp.]